MSIHTERINAEFQRVLSETIRDTVKDPRLSPLCSVARVEVTKDQKYAKVLMSVYDKDEDKRRESIDVLNNAAGFIAREMNRRIKMRRMPSLTFELDTSIEYSVYVSKVLRDLNVSSDSGEEGEEE